MSAQEAGAQKRVATKPFSSHARLAASAFSGQRGEVWRDGRDVFGGHVGSVGIEGDVVVAEVVLQDEEYVRARRGAERDASGECEHGIGGAVMRW